MEDMILQARLLHVVFYNAETGYFVGRFQLMKQKVHLLQQVFFIVQKSIAYGIFMGLIKNIRAMVYSLILLVMKEF